MTSDPQNDLCYLSATDALAAFRTKALSPVELLQAQIDRAATVEPRVNALTFTHYDRAMEEAKAAEARYARGEPKGALDGLPVAVKDEGYIAGLPTSGGSLIQKDFVPDTTSPVNERVLAEGGIVHARTATPEFSTAGYCWSRLWGVTRNPWNPDFTPGGSSGGSGAALASGTAPLATGSDIGGSIRIPASCCGVVGYKPPYGRNPEDPPFNLDFYCHNGPMARTVRDAILLQNVMCGPHPKDIATLRPKLTLPMDYAPIKGMKIALSRNLSVFEVDADVGANTLAAADVFRSLGATVTEVDLNWPADLLEHAMNYLNHIFGTFITPLLDDHADEMTTYVRDMAERSLNARPADFVASLNKVGEMYATLGPLLEDYDLLICPTNALPAVAADFDHSKGSVTINGKEVSPFLGWVMTVPFNMLSRCPVLSVPSGFAANGVPTGLQIVGRSYSDGDVFRAGLAYETALGGWFTAPGKRPALG
ncbi:MAG: amidase [Rhodobacteraceae bacterium]|nr:amidase [Paracoccaceae bacterium]